MMMNSMFWLHDETYKILNPHNNILKRKSSFEDNEKKKKIKELQQQKLKGILKCCSNSKYENSTSQSPKSLCGICYDFIQDFDIIRGSATCNHPFCANCISNHVADQLSQNILNVYCPKSDCCGELKPQHLQHILPQQVIGRWEFARLESMDLNKVCSKFCNDLLLF
ncbi:putative E3 ubiquitin-protein ligase RNF217 [Trifolium repens]|jgi:hypothetical protein|nr:putative E3 ubiquitin-protein ligase RNF217 [Trifolium repens]